jgi:hypothetical protein
MACSRGRVDAESFFEAYRDVSYVHSHKRIEDLLA